MNIVREDLAWCGGLFEGEGCIHIPYNNKGGLCVSIGMTDKDVLDRFSYSIQMGNITGPYVPSQKYKPYWQWKLYGEEKCQAFIAMVWPWLGKRRKSKAIEMIEYMKERPLNRSKYAKLLPTCVNGHDWHAHGHIGTQGSRVCKICQEESNKKITEKRRSNRLKKASQVIERKQ